MCEPAVFGLPGVCRRFQPHHRSDTPAATPIGDTRELGWMLHDMDFTHPSDPQPRFFNAKMVAGIVEVPHFEEARG